MTITYDKPNIFDTQIPEELKTLKQWVLWGYKEQFDEKGIATKPTKVPLQPNGSMAESNNENTWVTFDEAFNTFIVNPTKFNGIGFMFKPPYVGFDTDDSIDLETGEIDPTTLVIMSTLKSYTEISPSGKGFHIIVKTHAPLPANRYKKKGNYECYEENRFFTFTGNVYKGLNTVEWRDKEATTIINKLFLKPEVTKGTNEIIPITDRLTLNEVYEVMNRSKNSNKLRLFLAGEWTAAGNFPSQSEADSAFLMDLAFFTQKDPQMMEEIFCASGMYRPEKWHRKQNNTYFGRLEIENAISRCTNVYKPKSPKKKKAEQDLKEAVAVEKKEQKVSSPKKTWWQTNPNGTRTFIHFELAQVVLDRVTIVRYPTPHSDLYYYNAKKGIFEQDKSGRQLNYIIRSFDKDLKTSHVREVSAYLQDTTPVINSLDTNHIAVENGLIDLTTFELKDFSNNVFLTQKISTSYNKDAFDPFVESTLQKVTDGYAASIQNIKEMFACVLYPKVLVPKMFYLYGRTAHNGKSSILNMIQETFNKDGGNISAVSPQRLANNTFAGSSMYGKLANIVDDQPDQIIEDSGSLKTIITGGYIEIERKGRDSETVKMNVTMITASNYFPNFKESGKQINRRLHIIPFDHDFSTDPDCVSDSESMRLIASESARQYVLKLAVETLSIMLSNPAAEKLTFNEKALEAGATFAEHNDPLADYFFEHDVEYFEDTIGTRVLQEYEEWCNNNRTMPLGAKRFKETVSTQLDMEWTTKRIIINGRSKTVKGFKKIKR